jgi:hypothetical protein
VEDGPVVVAARGERREVLAGFRGVAGVELYEDRALVFLVLVLGGWGGEWNWRGKGACHGGLDGYVGCHCEGEGELRG